MRTAMRANIIVVDDDKAVRDSLKFSLELDGHTVHTCDGARSLLAYPGLKDAACVVMDYHMPGTDGLGLHKALKAQGLRVPVIMITSSVTSDLCQRARAAGIFSVVEKPLEDGVLQRQVHTALAASCSSSP